MPSVLTPSLYAGSFRPAVVSPALAFPERYVEDYKDKKWWLPDEIFSPSLNIEVTQSALQKSDLLRREYFQLRRKIPNGELRIVVVLSQDKEVVSVGRPMVWRQGVAKAVQQRINQVHELVFASKKSVKHNQCLSQTALEAEQFYSSRLCHGACAKSGVRARMEDNHIAEGNLWKWYSMARNDCGRFYANGQEPSEHISTVVDSIGRDIFLFAVFDGHRGEQASELARSLYPLLFCAALSSSSTSRAVDLKLAMMRSLEELERRTLLRAAEEKWDSGTTAVICVIHRNMLILGNIGDSRAVLSSAGSAVDLTQDQNLKVQEEVRRVISFGGHIIDGYLNDQLSVSRAIGDYDLELGAKVKGLSANPAISVNSLTSDDEFILIASDGLWDVFKSQDAVTFVRLSLMRHGDPEQSARELVNEALSRGSADNVTAIVVSLHKRPNFRWKDRTADVGGVVTLQRRTSKGPGENCPSLQQRPRINFSAISQEMQRTLLHAAHNVGGNR